MISKIPTRKPPLELFWCVNCSNLCQSPKILMTILMSSCKNTKPNVIGQFCIPLLFTKWLMSREINVRKIVILCVIMKCTNCIMYSMYPSIRLFIYLLFTFRWRLNPYKLSTHKGQWHTPVLGNKNVFSILNRAHANSIAK